MEDRIITVNKHSEISWEVECPCGFFSYWGNLRTNTGQSMLSAQRDAKNHNKNHHRGKYRVSTEGSELF